MVMRIAGLFVLLMGMPPTAAALSISADESRMQYGKPVWLTIETARRDVALKTLDFTRWDEQVVVLSEREVQTDAAGLQRWRVRLYPRREGRIELPGLLLAGERSEALRLEIVPAVDPRTGAPIGIDCDVSTATPYQQQQVLAVCEFRIQDELVLFEYPRQTLAGAQLLPMQVTRETRAPGHSHHAGWVVLPQRSGDVEYDLPPLQLVRDGVITHRFYLPKLQLQVRPLPLYLPGTIPVARVQVTRFAFDSWHLAPARLANVQLHVNVDGAPLDALPDFAQLVRSDASLQTYAAATQHTQRIDTQGIAHTLEYTIPVTPRRQGLYRLPTLHVQYFDAQSGTLQSAEVPGPRVLILAWWSKLLVVLLAGALALPAARYAHQLLRRLQRRTRTYRAALMQLGAAPTLAHIRHAMQLMAQAEGWSANITYRQWHAKMVRVRACTAQFPYQSLYEVSYAGVAHDLHALRESLQRICRQRMYRLFPGTD